VFLTNNNHSMPFGWEMERNVMTKKKKKIDYGGVVVLYTMQSSNASTRKDNNNEKKKKKRAKVSSAERESLYVLLAPQTKKGKKPRRLDNWLVFFLLLSFALFLLLFLLLFFNVMHSSHKTTLVELVIKCRRSKGASIVRWRRGGNCFKLITTTEHNTTTDLHEWQIFLTCHPSSPLQLRNPFPI